MSWDEDGELQSHADRFSVCCKKILRDIFRSLSSAHKIFKTTKVIRQLADGSGACHAPRNKIAFNAKFNVFAFAESEKGI